MGIFKYWATFCEGFLWWKMETTKVETRRVFTRYPRELLQDSIAHTSSLYKCTTMEDRDNDVPLWPFSTKAPLYSLGFRAPALSTFEEMKQLVALCIHIIDPNAGDITPFVAANLNHETVEARALLPRLEYTHAYQVRGVTAECKDMLRPIMQRAQKQHAHDLKVNGMVDILIKWNCAEMICLVGLGYTNEQTLLVSKRDWDVFKKAWDCHYKVLGWEGQRIKNYLSSTCGNDVTRPISGRKGGFYTVVTEEHYKELKRFADKYYGKIDITVLIEPKVMTVDEQAEMELSRNKRAPCAYNTPSLSRKTEKTKEQQEREESEYHQRKKNTFAAARRRDVDKYEKLDFRVGYSF